jgi:hypothetical protein
LLLDRIPTKENLCRRGILHIDEALCTVCDSSIESSRHLILHCNFAAKIWYAVCNWLGVVTVLPPDVAMSYGLLVGSGRNKRIRKGFSIVWLALAWVLWKNRNDCIFNNVVGSVDDVVGQIQRLSWQWYLNKLAKNSCLLYEWIWSPEDCMIRG